MLASEIKIPDYHSETIPTGYPKETLTAEHWSSKDTLHLEMTIPSILKYPENN